MENNELIEELQAKRERFAKLPTSEQIKRNRENNVDFLLSAGYITTDEAKGYRLQLTELPQDRKGLVVAYFLLGLVDNFDTPLTIEANEQIQDFVHSFRLRDRGVWQDGKVINDVLTEEERERWLRGVPAICTMMGVKRAETFVDSKRKRIRNKIQSILQKEIAVALLEPEPEGYEYIPYLRNVLQENGYRDKGKALSDKDKQAIQTAALYYLDLIEFAILSGIGRLREEKYEDSLSKGEMDTYYDDVYDEVLTQLAIPYQLLKEAIWNFCTDVTSKGAIDYLNSYPARAFNGELKDRYKILKGGKFSYLLEEATIC